MKSARLLASLPAEEKGKEFDSRPEESAASTGSEETDFDQAEGPGDFEGEDAAQSAVFKSIQLFKGRPSQSCVPSPRKASRSPALQAGGTCPRKIPQLLGEGEEAPFPACHGRVALEWAEEAGRSSPPPAPPLSFRIPPRDSPRHRTAGKAIVSAARRNRDAERGGGGGDSPSLRRPSLSFLRKVAVTFSPADPPPILPLLAIAGLPVAAEGGGRWREKSNFLKAEEASASGRASAEARGGRRHF